MSTRVLLADDHTAMREALRALIEQRADLELVGEAEDGRAAVRLALELRPDVVVMDVSMPVMDGIEATSRIAAAAPGTKVVGVSMHADRRLAKAVLEAGASGYALKDRADEELVSAIRVVTAGETYVSPRIEDRIAKSRPLAGAPGRAR
jgi:DNA-binding NarL/FixJ family response regulator